MEQGHPGASLHRRAATGVSPGTNIGKSEASMVQALRDGKLVVASMGPGTFTKGGHFIVLTGITESGKIRVNDPKRQHKEEPH